MGGIMGGGQQQRSTEQRDPWGPQQPYLKEIMQEAQDWYKGPPAEFWQGTANAPLTPEMQAALGGIYNRGMQGNPIVDQAQGAVGAVAGGATAGMNPAYNFLMGNVYGGNQNPALGYAQDIAGNVQTNPALQYLNAEASGANVGKNPWLEATYNRAAQPLVENFRQTQVPALQSDYALSGRYGSRAHAGALGQAQAKVGDQLTNLATGIYGNAYEADRGRQAAAASGLTGAYAQDIQNRIGAGSFLSGIYDQNLQRQLYGAQQLGQLGQQDIGNMLRAAEMAPGLAGTDYQDLNAAMGAANIGQGRTQAEQDLARQRFEYQQNQDLARLQQYSGLIYGFPSGYGTTTTTSPRQGGSGLGSILGAGLGLAGSFFGIPPQIGMGVGGMMGSAFG